MKEASTVVIAGLVAPKTSVSWRALPISSRIASLPASNADISRWLCSSKSSRPFSKSSPAWTWASLAYSWARLAKSPPFSRSSSRASCPVLGVRSSAAAAPSRAPMKNHPRYPAASPLEVRSSLIGHPPGFVLLVSADQLLDEDVQSLLDSRRGPDELADPREPPHESRHPADEPDHLGDAGCNLIHPADDGARPLHFLCRVLRQAAELFGQGLELARRRADLALQQHEHGFGPERHSLQGEQRGHQHHRHDDGAERDDQEERIGHGTRIIAKSGENR